MPDIARMKDKSLVRVLLKETRDSNHGDNSLEIGTEVVAVVEVAILVFPGHEATNLSNDSYCVVPTQFVRHFSRCCQNVVNHVPSAILHGQLQKKGVGPVQSMSKMKVVKGVLCINLLSSVPSVQNAPHVVTEISVGGRLQSFWQVWQEWGSNPRVVSVLSRDGSV